MFKIRDRGDDRVECHSSSSFVLYTYINHIYIFNINHYSFQHLEEEEKNKERETWYSINFSACSLSSSLDSLKNLNQVLSYY